jgi:exo-1,4-beta-D-glucosaminidase
MNEPLIPPAPPLPRERLRRAAPLVSAVACALGLAGPAAASTMPLAEGWGLQSSAKVKDPGEVIATAAYKAEGWYPVTVPSTVVAGLVKNNVYPDPYVGMNIRSYPGMAYPIGKNFSKFPMPADSPFAVSWWYRKAFSLPAGWKGQSVWLHFAGINYRANIWINGQQIARQEEAAGALRTYEFNVTPHVKPGAQNVVAVQVWTPKENDLAITFVDWNPAPPDKSMGLWREVYLSTSGPAAVRYPAVIADVNEPTNDSALLTVTALLENGTSRPLNGKLKGRIEKISFEQPVSLAPNEKKDVTFDPAQFAQLKMNKPRLWWPLQMGEPYLHDLTLRLEVDGKVSHEVTTKVGIREVTSELNADKKRVFSINGKTILIRGAGWSSDMLLTYDPRRIEDQLRYVRDMGLNTVRQEGKLEPDHFFDLTDRMGILVMTGWCCCDHWEKWDKWKPEDHVVAEKSLRSQIYRLRGRASPVMWLNGSDFPPPPEVEKMYLRVEKELRWPNPTVSSATAKPTPVSGESGVKMTGPYEWIPPQYWLEDSKRGGAYGFNSETSPGPAPPPIESLRKMFPPDKLWPPNEVWDFHSGGDVFTDIKKFSRALDARYGTASTVEDFAAKSQIMAYEGIRAMFEAYSRNKYRSTGVIQWMLNNAWPGLIWHLYDYYMRPGGGYFGAKIALEPLHPLYGYDDRAIWVVNSKYREEKGLKLTARVLNLDLTEKFTQTTTLDAAPDSTQKVITLPQLTGLSATYFVHLALEDAAGRKVGSNLYWLSTKPDVFDWDKSEWFYTPTKSFADMTALASLPKVKLKMQHKTARRGTEVITTVNLENPGKALAFFVRLKATKGPQGEEILPVLWQDNYLSLLPGEKRTVSATFRAADLGSTWPAVELSGLNLSQ